jgi:hypothetical protein
LVSLIGSVGPCVLFRVYTVTNFCGFLGPCALPLLSPCVWFLLDMRCFSVFCWLVTCGCKNRKWSPNDLICIYILVDIIKTPVLDFCFGCFKI